MITDYSIFAKKKLQQRFRKLENDYDVCYYNVQPQNTANDMAKYQKIMRVEEGSVIEKIINKPVLDLVVNNTKNSLLSNYQFVAYEDGIRTTFLINPVSKQCDRICDLPKNWFNKYIKQIQVNDKVLLSDADIL